MLFVIQKVRKGGLFGRKKKAAPAPAPTSVEVVEAADVETTKVVEVPVRAIEQESATIVTASPSVDNDAADGAKSTEEEDVDKKFSMLLVVRKAYEVGYDNEKIEKQLAKALRPVVNSYDWALLLATLNRRTIEVKEEDWSALYEALQRVLDIDSEEIRNRWYNVTIEKIDTESTSLHYGVMHKGTGRVSSAPYEESNRTSGPFRDSSGGYSDRIHLEMSDEGWQKFEEEQRRREGRSSYPDLQSR